MFDGSNRAISAAVTADAGPTASKPATTTNTTLLGNSLFPQNVDKNTC
jgi:hypothetical protein